MLLSAIQRETIVHFHIFKNAGSSVDRLLQRYFGDRYCTFEGETATDVVTPSRISSFLSVNRNVSAVSTHLGRPGDCVRDGIIPIVFIRHPIDRARSIYSYLRRDKTQIGSEIARSTSFAGFVRFMLTDVDTGGVNLRNYQVIHLSGASFRTRRIFDAKATIDDANEAASRIAAFPAVGVVRRFAESLAWLDDVYGSRFPGLFTATAHENRTNLMFTSDADEIERTRSELGSTLFDDLCDANRLDLSLYSLAAERLAKRTESRANSVDPTP